MKDIKELQQIRSALINWMQSQEIAPQEGVWVMVTLAGAVIGCMADDDENMKAGIEIIYDILLQTAISTYEEQQ